MERHSSGVIFDFDDTLADTRRLLLPAALAAVAAALDVDVGLLDIEAKQLEHLLARVPDLTPERWAAAEAAWYSSDISALEPAPGARQVLEALRGRTHLFLVTRGGRERQSRKIEVCGLGGFFDAVRIRPSEEPGSKRDDFVALLDGYGIAPGRCAVVGDDPLDELKHGADLGCLVLRVPEVPLTEVPGRLERAGLLTGGQGFPPSR